MHEYVVYTGLMQKYMTPGDEMFVFGSMYTVGNQLPSTQLPSTKNGGGVER